MFATIALPASPTKLGDLFGISNDAFKKFRFSFPTSNAGDATIAKPAGLAAGVTNTAASPGTTSQFTVDRLGSISVSGTITDKIVLEYYDVYQGLA